MRWLRLVPILVVSTTSALVLSLLAGCGSPPADATAAAASPPAPARETPHLPPEATPLGRLPKDVRPTHESLSFVVDPASDGFSGTAEITLHLDRPRDVIWLHGRGLRVSSISLELASHEQVAATWREADPTGVAAVSLSHAVGPGEATLHIAYSADYDPSLVGVYRVKTGPSGTPAVFSKFEAIYARRAFPGFDEPSFKVPFDLSLTVPAASWGLSNMPLAGETPAPGGRKTLRFATTPPLSTYLVAFAVGPFETLETVMPPDALRPKPLPVDVVALKGRGPEGAYALEQSPKLLAEEERYFGVAFPYPKLDLIAVPDFQSGAMENAGAITFRDSALLVDKRTASTGQKIGVLSTVAHELAHQWFGDLTTMDWWNDLWLNEGFATFLAERTMAAVHPELETRLDQINGADRAMRTDGLPSARRVRQPIESTNDITNAFDGITYEKGSAVLVMVEHFLGAEVFRRGVHRYLVEHAEKNGTTDDLVAAVSREAGRDLAPLFASFLDQPGLPVVHARNTCEAGHGRAVFETSRWRPAGAPPESSATPATWDVPVCVRSAHGGEVGTTCALLPEGRGSIDLPACADWIYPNADAAGYYRFTLPPKDLADLRARGMSALSTAERMAFAQDLSSSFDAASLPAAEVLRALEPLAHDPHGAVAPLPLDVLSTVSDTLLEGDDRARFRAHVTRLYLPAAAALGWHPAATDDAWRRAARSQILAYLALALDEPRTLNEGARLGRAYLGIGADGALAPQVVDPDLAGLALSSAAREAKASDPPERSVFAAILRELGKSEDASMRERLLRALGNVRDPSLVQQALDLSLEPKLRQNERLRILSAFLREPPTREAAWTWLKTHFDALSPMLPDRYAGYVPGMPTFCDRAHADDLRAFFTPRVPRMTGGPRNLTQALDRIEQCVARHDAQRESAREYVRSLKR
jgi:alanyl aminopeptidase